MPVVNLYPSGAGDLQEWTVIGGGTAHAALATQGGPYLATFVPGARVRLAFGDLPAAASTINSVTAFGLFASETDEGSTVRHALRLSGVDSLGATFAPPSGGSAQFSTAFALAPDGAAWTVAKVNALQAGPDLVTGVGPGVLCDFLWLAVDYAEATTTVPPGPVAEVRFPDSTGKVTMPSRDPASVPFPVPTGSVAMPSRNPVDIPFPVRIKRPVNIQGD